MSDDWTTADGRRVRIIDADTGEVLDTDGFLVDKKVPSGRDYWWRFLVCDLISVMEDLPGRQMHAIGTVLDNVSPYDNTIPKTQSELAKEAGVSRQTMVSAMRVLQQHGIIKMVHNGLYMIDPRFMSQGGGRRKLTTLAIRYDSVSQGQLKLVDDQDDAQDDARQA